MNSEAIKFLPVVLLMLAAFFGMTMLVPGKGKKAKRKPGPGAYDDEETPVPVNVAGESKVAYEPSPEELEEVAECVDSPGATAMDEGPTDIEKAIASTGDSDQLRLTLVELMRSGMTIRDASGRIVTKEQLLAKPEKKDNDVPQSEGSNIRKAIEKLDIEFHNNVGRI
jgi:hypothetical protein